MILNIESILFKCFCKLASNFKQLSLHKHKWSITFFLTVMRAFRNSYGVKSSQSSFFWFPYNHKNFTLYFYTIFFQSYRNRAGYQTNYRRTKTDRSGRLSNILKKYGCTTYRFHSSFSILFRILSQICFNNFFDFFQFCDFLSIKVPLISPVKTTG